MQTALGDEEAIVMGIEEDGALELKLYVPSSCVSLPLSPIVSYLVVFICFVYTTSFPHIFFQTKRKDVQGTTRRRARSTALPRRHRVILV